MELIEYLHLADKDAYVLVNMDVLGEPRSFYGAVKELLHYLNDETEEPDTDALASRPVRELEVLPDGTVRLSLGNASGSGPVTFAQLMRLAGCPSDVMLRDGKEHFRCTSHDLFAEYRNSKVRYIQARGNALFVDVTEARIQLSFVLDPSLHLHSEAAVHDADGRLLYRGAAEGISKYLLGKYVDRITADEGCLALHLAMKTRTVEIPSKTLSAIRRYLEVEPEDEKSCLNEDEKLSYTADFGDGFEMDVECCGVQYWEGEVNTAWAQAILFRNGCELVCTEPCDTFDDMWELEYDGMLYVAEIKEV